MDKEISAEWHPQSCREGFNERMPAVPCEDDHDIACRSIHILVDDVHVLTILLLRNVKWESTRVKVSQLNRFIFQCRSVERYYSVPRVL